MMEYEQFRAINTQVVIGVEGLFAAEAFEQAQAYILQSEQRFSRFLENSELTALNRSAGKWFSASPEMMAVLAEALECYDATGGLFNPAILPDLQAAGYTRSFEKLADPDSNGGIVQMKPFVRKPFSLFQLDTADQRVYLPEGMQIDLGGIAKGWIVEQAARKIAHLSPNCAVNAGGDMFLIGRPQNQSSWEIGLEDPRDPSQDLLTLLVEDGAVATSSVAKRIWRQGDLNRHHLIDPRTGQPAETNWLSVTVFSPRAVLAETFAKALLISGSAGAKELVERHPELDFIAVDAEKQLWTSPTHSEKLYELA